MLAVAMEHLVSWFHMLFQLRCRVSLLPVVPSQP